MLCKSVIIVLQLLTVFGSKYRTVQINGQEKIKFKSFQFKARSVEDFELILKTPVIFQCDVIASNYDVCITQGINFPCF
jgi:hypothetical protein